MIFYPNHTLSKYLAQHHQCNSEQLMQQKQLMQCTQLRQQSNILWALWKHITALMLVDTIWYGSYIFWPCLLGLYNSWMFWLHSFVDNGLSRRSPPPQQAPMPAEPYSSSRCTSDLPPALPTELPVALEKSFQRPLQRPCLGWGWWCLHLLSSCNALLCLAQSCQLPDEIELMT